MVSFVVVALYRVNIVEDTTILVFHVRVIVLHVPRHSGFVIPRRSGNARLCARGSGGRLPSERGSGEAFAPSLPRAAGGVAGASPNETRD